MIKRWLDVLIPALLLIAALALRLDEGRAIEQIRNLVFDNYQRLAPRPYVPQPVHIVDIDEESLKRLGQWPWPRSQVARLVDRLTQAGAAAIALDILFAEPDRTAPANLLWIWRDQPEIETIRTELTRLPDPDAQLAASVAQSNVATAFVLLNQPAAEASPDGKGTSRVPAVKPGFATAGDDPVQFVPNFAGAVSPLPALEAAARGNGAVNAAPDADGVIRRVPLLQALGSQLYPTLAGEALRIAQGATTYVIKSSGASGEQSFGMATGVNHVKVGAAIVPTDPSGHVILYDSGTVPERFVPAWKVLEPSFDPNTVAGQIILVGTTVEGLKDLRTTPLNPVMSGVEVHAQVIEQMLGGQYLQRPDWATGAELLYLVLFGALLILALQRVGPLWSAGIAVAAIIAAFSTSWLAFARSGWLLDPLFPGIVALLVYISGTLIGYLRTEHEKRYVRGAFGRYLSPILVEQLTRNPERLKLGGEMRELTLMFCDIRGFTQIAERLEPQALTRLINGFLTPMTSVIQQAGGTIDKYIGDCIMAFWNAPLDDPKHAANALRAALAMRAELERLNQGWREEAARENRDPVTIAIGIGVNTGRCCVGNMGSEQRFDYSVLGDAVNIASRLEGLSRAYGVDLVIGEGAAAQAPEMALLEIDQVRVKGRTTPLRIFTALGDKEVRDAAWFQTLAGQHATLIAAYRGQLWPEATRALATCRAAADSRLGAFYDLYERRISDYAAAPPPAGWDGVFIAATKSG